MLNVISVQYHSYIKLYNFPKLFLMTTLSIFHFQNIVYWLILFRYLMIKISSSELSFQCMFYVFVSNHIKHFESLLPDTFCVRYKFIYIFPYFQSSMNILIRLVINSFFVSYSLNIKYFYMYCLACVWNRPELYIVQKFEK